LNTNVIGAHIGFAGAIWTDRPHLEVLAPTLPLFYHATDINMRARAARYFGAAKKAIYALRDYYEYHFPAISGQDVAEQPIPTFPYPTQYISLEGSNPQAFKYLSQLDRDKLVFLGMAANNAICIKFVRRYSKEAHLKCCSLGFAPALHGFQAIPGGWHMVVMDFVGDEYQLLDGVPAKAPYLSEVKEKLVSLHQAGYVHGDVRRTNIMVKINGESGILLLDFDWAGVLRQVRYPMHVNTKDIRRPAGAVDNELITAEHDIAMIAYMC
jgi:hypothetical protein